MAEALVQLVGGAGAVVGAVAVVADEGPAGKHDVSVLGEPAAPPLLGRGVVGG